MGAFGSNHPSDQTLRAYGVGELDGPLADSVHSHLEVCTGCRQRVAELSADTFLGRLRDAQVRSEPPAPGGPSLAGMSDVGEPPASSSVPPPTSIPSGLVDHPDYEILGELGRGGMGVVYLAQNKLMGRKEVLKVVNRELGVLDRFLREIRNAAQLHHPNIVTAYSAFRAGETVAFAMEHVEGEDLASHVKAKGPLPVPHACYFAYQAALGLQYAHEKGMVHRDIKPGNLILAREGRRAVVKVLDFGLAKASREGPVEKGLTHEGQMLGTPDYIAPEQSLDATKSDIRADIYSLGCTLYYLLTGGPPFPGPSLYEVLQAHHSTEAKSLNLVRPDVTRDLAAVVAKMMAKDADRRYQTPGEVAKALKPFFKPGESGPAADKAELFQAGQPPPVDRVPRSVPMAAANLAQSPPVPAAGERLDPVRPVSLWQTLIGIAGAARKSARPDRAAPSRVWPPPLWIWPTAAGVLLLGFLVPWGSRVVKINSGDEVNVVKNVPENAVVKKEPAVTQARALTTPAAPAAHVHSPTSRPQGATQPPAFTATAAPAPPPRRPSVWSSPSVRMTFVEIEGGEFLMGSPDDDKEAKDDEKPQHRVRVSPFYLGATEVTQAQYRAVMGNNPSHFSSTGAGKRQIAGQATDSYPVENVSWFDAIRFCNAMSRRDRLAPYYAKGGRSAPQDVRIPSLAGTGYRLPTEAEWEFACRAGTTTRYFFGEGPPKLGEYAWYEGNSRSMTHPVAVKHPNGLGLYDIYGNVWEWCWDWHLEGYARNSPFIDPQGPLLGSCRVGHGGSWAHDPNGCRSATRDYTAPVGRDKNLGFRVARNLPAQNEHSSADAHAGQTAALGSAVNAASGQKAVKRR
jgi:formylglycine-generating enzyme required for sulfatase activity/serine/threonine protein kinase